MGILPDCGRSKDQQVSRFTMRRVVIRRLDYRAAKSRRANLLGAIPRSSGVRNSFPPGGIK
jgi:hypothetical protein